jgi:hypothetical protein
MNYLGKLTNHHLTVTDSEQLAVVNSLAFFHAIFDPNRSDSISEIVKYWQDVAADTHLSSVDALATRIAKLH